MIDSLVKFLQGRTDIHSKHNPRQIPLQLTSDLVLKNEIALMQLLEWDLNKVTLVHFVDNY